MKKFISFCVALVMAVTTVSLGQSVTASPTEDEQWSSPFTSETGLHGFELMEVSGSRSNVSLLTGRTASGEERMCSSLDDASCAGDVFFKAVLEPCSAAVPVDCIESVVATDAAGNAIPASFNRFFPTRGVNEYTGAPSQSIPSGRAPSLWTIPGVAHSNGTQYLVSVQVSGGRVGGNATQIPREVSASINPVSLYQTACDVQYHSCIDQYFEGTRNGQPSVEFGGAAYDQDAGIRCVGWGENGMCALKHAFPSGMRAQITVKMSTAPSGWLHGRMLDPSASITTTSGVTTMVIDAAPTKVPAVGAAYQWSDLPAHIQQWFDTNCPENKCGSRRGQESLSLPGDQRNAVSTPVAYKETSFSQLELWSEFLEDKASALPSYWSVRTLSNEEMTPACIKNGTGVTGIVSTNATLYSEGPPTFDNATKTLNYKVAALHYEKDGTTKFLGRYDLLLRPDIASCLYGIDDLAVTSDVEVVSAAGQEQTATTSMTRSAEWFKFSAANYTHSAPTIKVKLAKLRPTLKRGKAVKVTTLTRRVKFKVPRGARVVTKVAASSRSRCVVQGKTIRALRKKGTCRISISVTPKPTKKVKKPKTIKRTVFVTIR